MLHKLESVTIYIDIEKCPLKYINIKEAGFDQNSRLPRLEKRTGQHGLDCSLHMVGVVCDKGIYYSRKERAYSKNPFIKNDYGMDYL